MTERAETVRLKAYEVAANINRQKGESAMPIIEAPVRLSFEQLVAAINQLSVTEKRKLKKHLDEMHSETGSGRAPKRNGAVHTKGQAKPTPISQETEATLLARIEGNSKLPEAEQRRFNRLRRKSESEALTEAEWAELQSLWQRVEQMTVTRLEALIALAQKRGTDVKTLMRELGLNKRRNVF